MDEAPAGKPERAVPAPFRDGSALVLAVGPALDAGVLTRLSRRLAPHEPQVRQVLLDLADVENVREGGIAALAQLARLLRRRGLTLVLLDPPGPVRRRLAHALPDAVWVH